MKTHTSLWLVATLVGCAGAEPANADFDAMAAALAPPDAPEATTLEASDSASFVEHAVQHRPELRASLEKWRAARTRIDVAPSQFGPLELSYAYYVSPIETRVGPQRHRVGVRQMFRWPGTSERSRAASRAAAEVEQVRHSAELVEIRWEVLDAYWALWAAQQEHAWHGEHQQIAELLADTVRGRVEVGNATLADVGQAELLVSRTMDMHQQSRRARRTAALRLGRVAHVNEVGELSDNPQPRLPAEDEATLVAAAAAHPEVALWLAREEAARSAVDREKSARTPSFGVGVDWIETGAAHHETDHSGRDAVIGTVMLSVPIRTGEVAAATEALSADAASHAANAEVARRRIETAVRETLVDIEESARRIALYEHTLVPQAEAVLGSVRGSYETGQTGVAALLHAQNELLELRLALVASRGEHEREWARLERLVGRPVAAKEAP